MGVAIDSIVSQGSIISGGRVIHSILSPGVRVNSFCEIEDSILMRNVIVGRNCRIRKAIIDADVIIPEQTEIGFDPDFDRERGFTVTPSGIVVVKEFLVAQ